MIHRLRLEKLWEPNWLVDSIGVDYFARVTAVSFLQQPNITDDGLARLEGMPDLTALYLDGSQVGDVRMPQVAGLTGISELSLQSTQVTDHGLAHTDGSDPSLELLARQHERYPTPASCTWRG